MRTLIGWTLCTEDHDIGVSSNVYGCGCRSWSKKVKECRSDRDYLCLSGFSMACLVMLDRICW